MRYDFLLGIVNNPLTKSLYNSDDQEGIITPGSPEFITTENGIKIATESGQALITEG